MSFAFYSIANTFLFPLFSFKKDLNTSGNTQALPLNACSFDGRGPTFSSIILL